MILNHISNITYLTKTLLRRHYSFLDKACTKLGNVSEKKDKTKRKIIKVYRYGGTESQQTEYYQVYELDLTGMNMVLDIMLRIKEIDPTFSFRRSCREGICGSCGINLQGSNTLACTSFIPDARKIIIRPIPHMYVIRDLVVDMSHFYDGYKSIRPYLIRKASIAPFGSSQYAQSLKERSYLEGLDECILCACCSSACPSYWWNGRRFLGPATLLNAYRWIMDSRDEDTQCRLGDLRDDFKAFRCHTIFNCTLACPKDLNPALAIAKLKRLITILDSRPEMEMNSMQFAKDKLDQSEKPI